MRVGVGVLGRVDVGLGVFVSTGVADGAVVNVLDGAGTDDVVDDPGAATGVPCSERQEIHQIARKINVITTLLCTATLHHSGQCHDRTHGDRLHCGLEYITLVQPMHD